jgi:hypothetical protein
MKEKKEAITHFKTFKRAVENLTGLKVVYLRVDNAKEYVKGEFEKFMEEEGGQYEPTIPHSPSQNGVAERANYTLACMARAMLIDADMSDFFWPFAIGTAVHLTPLPTTWFKPTRILYRSRLTLVLCL